MSIEELELRDASVDDLDDLYLWRNNPVVRGNSFSIEPLPREEYSEWFRQKAQAVDTVIYVGCCQDCKIGTIRFEDRLGQVKVSVMLNPQYFGKGFGTQCIKKGTKKFIKNYQTQKIIVAEIKKDNLASIKAFEKAGYVRDVNNGREDCFMYVFYPQGKGL